MHLHFLILAAIAIVSTTLDDIIVILLLYLYKRKQLKDETKENYLLPKILFGQFIGFSIIIGISLIGLLFAFYVPDEYSDLLGFIPLLLGLYKVYEIIKEDYFEVYYNHETGNEETTTLIVSDVSNETNEVKYETTNSSSVTTITRDDLENEDFEQFEQGGELFDTIPNTVKILCDPVVLEAIVFNLASSADNIIVYIVLMSTLNSGQIAIVITFFYGILAVNMLTSTVILKSEIVHYIKHVEQYSKYIIATLFILLGLFILSESVISPIRSDVGNWF